MRGRMMAVPLTIPAIARRAAELWPHKPIVSRAADRSIVRTTYGACLRRARQLAVALQRAGIKPGDRVATFCWNHQVHLEAYYGVPLAGAVVHTLNLRLHPSDLAYIVEHAEDAAVVVDAALLDVFARFRSGIPDAKVIVVGDRAAADAAGAVEYEAFIGGASADEYVDRVDDDRSAAALCYTSGTTGRPKGVLYSHYALCMHALGLSLAFGLREADTVMPVVPMFHVNAWGLPFVCAMVGTGLVLPGSCFDPASVLELLASERVTFTGGVPTVWVALRQALEAEPGRYDLSSLTHGLCGGSALPASLIKAFDQQFGIRIVQGWGMTETSPLATVANVDSRFGGLTPDERYALGAKQGWPVPFIEIRVMTPDGEAAHDGATMGELEVRGPWVASGYYRDDAPDRFSADGWFRTGDVATIDATGCVQIQDRAKDLIKSGGEWISSVALESALVAHPAVAEAAVIAIPHPHWQERPLAVVVLRKGAAATCEDLHAFLEPQFAKWWLPDAYEFVESLPRTPTGKLVKYALRERYRDYRAGS